MYQKAGTGTQLSPVVSIDEALNRFKTFPEIVQSSPAAYETEVATYDTLPLPLPTPVEQEAFLFALRDAREKQLHFIQTRNDLEFASRNPMFFENLPPSDVLSKAISDYTKLINAVTDHAIGVSRGQIMPPRIFDPSELSPPIVEPAPIPLLRAVPPEPTPEIVLVPLVEGKKRQAAEEEIKKHGLVVGTIVVQEVAQQGVNKVINQNPAAFTSVTKGTAVNLTTEETAEFVEEHHFPPIHFPP
jgi:hypothetical protein